MPRKTSISYYVEVIVTAGKNQDGYNNQNPMIYVLNIPPRAAIIIASYANDNFPELFDFTQIECFSQLTDSIAPLHSVRSHDSRSRGGGGGGQLPHGVATLRL